MDLDMASYVFNWLAHIDLACIVCNWDPVTQSWVPYAAAGAGTGLGAYPGLSDLIDDMLHPPPAVGAPGVGEGWHAGWSGIPVPDENFEPTGPVDPHDLQDMTQEERGAAEDQEQQRLRDQYEENNPDATTAGQPEPTTWETVEETVREVVYHTFFTLGTR